MSFYSNIKDAFYDPDQEKIDKMAHDMNNNKKMNYYSSQGDFQLGNSLHEEKYSRNVQYDENANKYANSKIPKPKEISRYVNPHPFYDHTNDVKDTGTWNTNCDDEDYFEFDEDKFNEIKKIKKKKECTFTLEHIYGCRKCRKLLKMITKGKDKDSFSMKDIVILFLIGIIIIIVMNMITNIYLKK